MPIDLSQYNTQFAQYKDFAQFVKFATDSVTAGKQRAVARLNEKTELGGIVKRTITPTKTDWVGVGVGRLACLKRANNTTRDAFKEAVSKIFGGTDHIPKSVWDAMKMDDYGKGKPLTARRIIAVATAILQAPDEVNQRLYNGMASSDPISKSGVPSVFASELQNILVEAHTRYLGAPTTPSALTPRDIVGDGAVSKLREMVVAANKEGRRITVEEFSTAMKPIYMRKFAAASIRGPLNDLAKDMGVGSINHNSITNRFPEILDDLLECKTPEETKTCFDKHKDKIVGYLNLRKDLDNYEKQFQSMVEKAINEGTGCNDVKFNFTERSTQKDLLSGKFKSFSRSILENTDAKKPGWSLEAAVQKRVDEVASGFIARIKEIDELVSNKEITAELGKEWRDELVHSANAENFFPKKVVDMAKELDPKTLIDAFKPGNDIKSVLKAIGEFAKKINEVGEKTYGSHTWHNEESVDGKNEVRHRIMEVLFEKNPGMKETLLARAKDVKDNMDSLIVWKQNKRGNMVRQQNEDWQLTHVIFGDPNPQPEQKIS